MTDLSVMYREGWKQLQSQLDEESQNKVTPVLGMDPEFLLVQMPESKIIPASRFLGRTGMVGCDSVTIGGGESIRLLNFVLPPVRNRESC